MNNEIYHAGVKGMKWGVRKAKSQKSNRVANGKARAKKALSTLSHIAITSAAVVTLVKAAKPVVERAKVFAGMGAIASAMVDIGG